MAHCRECGSSLCLYICVLCGDCCEEGDALPWGPEDTDAHAHFSCVARVQLSTAKTRFVIVAGKGRAAEFCRDTIGTVRS